MLNVTASTVQAQMVYLVAIWYRSALLLPDPSVEHERELISLSVASHRVPEVPVMVPLMRDADNTSGRHGVKPQGLSAWVNGTLSMLVQSYPPYQAHT